MRQITLNPVYEPSAVFSMKAMILAAGRGARLSPLTDSTPKPLLLVQGRTLIDWQLDRLIAAGFTRFIINLGYLGAQIQSHLALNPRAGIKINFSLEPENALETGGGIVAALPLLGSAPFALVNADVWTDFDFSRLKAMTSATYRQDWRGHLVLVQNPSHNLSGDFSLQNGWISNHSALGNSHSPDEVQRGATGMSFTFAGISVLHPDLFRDLSLGRYPLAPILQRAVSSNTLSGEIHYRQWNDIGTPERLNEINNI